MFEHTRYDALVIGARCAGAAAAMLMARHGLRVLAIDRGKYGADTLSTHALMRGGVLQLARWGVLPRVQAAGAPALHSTTFHYGDEIVDVPIGPSHGVAALYAPRRTVLDKALVDAARNAGAEVRHGHALAGLIRGSEGRVHGAVVIDCAGALVEVAADLVVGADGIGSSVARLAGAPLQRRGRHASAVVYGHWSGIKASGYHWFYGKGVSTGVIPTNSGQHCIFAAVPAVRFRDDLRGAAGYHRILAAAAPDLADTIAEATLEGTLRAFAGQKSLMRQPYGPGWALAGDAGYFKDPLTAHGMTDALRDAELVAKAAAKGSDSAFADYAAVRDELSIPLFEVTDAIASFDWDVEAIKQHHLDLNQAMKREVALMAALGEVPTGEVTRTSPRVLLRAEETAA